MDEAEVLAFVRRTIRSAWSLELLLLLCRDPQRRWTKDALVQELRGSAQLVDDSLANLSAAGLVEIDQETAHYRPQSAELAEYVSGLVTLYAAKPITVLRTIFTSPSDRIRSFSDAFLFKKK